MKNPLLKPWLAAVFLCSVLSVHGQVISVNRGFEKGMMNGNYKTGTWQYFDSTGVLDLEIDYDRGILTYLKKDTTEYVIFRNGEWVVSKVDIPPRYIGSWVEFYDILNSSVDYPMQARYRDVVGTVYISFEVDTNGRAVNFTSLKDIGCECAWECERVLRLVPNYWLVANVDGRKYKSRFMISCEFGIVLDGKRLAERSPRPRKNKTEIPDLPLAKELKGITYIIKKGYNPK